ncbi:MAG TPA: ABC transporter permease [Vicinamibacteria bacterium]
MTLGNTARIALTAMRRNKVRAALTMLGVVIGVASVIAMVALGSGARAAIDEQVQAQGANLVFVSSGSFGRGGGGVRGGAGTVQSLTLDDARVLAELPGVRAFSPQVRGRVQAITGNQNWNTQVEGGNEQYLAIRNWTIASGENFNGRDVLTAQNVCLLGATVAATLFPDADPVGQLVRLKHLPFRVVGVLGPKGQGQWGNDQDDVVIAPYTTIQKKLLGITFLHSVMLTAASAEAVEPLAVSATRLMRERHRIASPEEDDFSVRTVEEMAATRTQMAQTMTLLLMSVASVSLLVGGIGIMNIMLVSVTERTREIGLRMAVGARTREVLLQFLSESVALSVAGGVLGIGLGLAASRLLTGALGWPTQVTASAIALAFGFAAAVGVFFGFYPARRASLLDPIEALRHE